MLLELKWQTIRLQKWQSKCRLTQQSSFFLLLLLQSFSQQIVSHSNLFFSKALCPSAINSIKAVIVVRLEIHSIHLRHNPLTPPPSSSAWLPLNHECLQIHFLHIRAPITVLTVGCTILILYFLALEFSFVIPSTPPPAPSFKVHPRDVLIVHLRHLSVWTFHKVVCHIFIRDAFLHFLLQPACWLLNVKLLIYNMKFKIAFFDHLSQSLQGNKGIWL